MLTPNARLAALVLEAAAAYPELKRAAEGSVVRSEWTSAPRYSEEPHHFEVQKARPGHRLAQRPHDPAGSCQYGFDASGRVAVERRFTELTGRAYETFFRHETLGTARFHFGYGLEKAWLSCAWIQRGPSGVEAIHTAYASTAESEATYHYDDQGRVQTLELCRRHPLSGVAREFRDFVYDEHDELRRVMWRTEAGACTVHFDRPSQDDRLLAAQPRLLAGLSDAIVAALSERAFDVPVGALAFSVQGGDSLHRLPPVVMVARRATLERLRDAHGPGSLAIVWNAAEWEDELALHLDDTLRDLCASASQDTWQNGLHAEVDHLLLRLAAAIEQRDLPLVRAPAFAVVVIEADGEEDAARQVSAQIGRDRRETLRQGGLL